MADPIVLNTDGPHSPDYTKQVGNALAEAFHVLNYATLPHEGAPGLEYPSDVYSLLGALYTGTERLPQLMAQLTGFLDGQGDSGTLADDRGRAPGTQIAQASYHLGEAHTCAQEMTTALKRAQSAISGLYVEGGDDE
jgi:hypothetical protein